MLGTQEKSPPKRRQIVPRKAVSFRKRCEELTMRSFSDALFDCSVRFLNLATIASNFDQSVNGNEDKQNR
jgi:hypothetical protein